MKALRIAILCAGTAMCAPAFAQDTAADETGGIGDIVVTAQKRAENVQDVPIAISAVSSEYLQSRDISSIDRLGTIAPNVKIERAPSNKTISQISIRGSVTINPAVTWEPAVGLYLDGVYIAKAQGSIFDVADLERVEVLRGPQGTLYGRNALAGAVNLVTRKPSGELRGSAEISYGNYDYWKGKAVLDLPAMGALSMKVSGQIQKRDGFVKTVANPFPQAFLARPTSVSDLGNLDGKSGMIQLRLKPEGIITADYQFDYSRYNQRTDFSQLVGVLPNSLFTDPAILGAIAPLGLYANPNRQSTASVDANPLYEKTRTYGHSLTIAADLGAATLKSITSYRNLRWQDAADLDGSPLDVANTQRDTSFHAYSQELQLTGEAMDDRLSYVVGAFAYREKAETLGPQRFFGFLNQIGAPGAADLQSDYGSHTRAWALYSQLDYRMTDALKLTLGARYTNEVKDIRRKFAVGTPRFTLFDLPYGGVPDAKFNNFSPTATLSYEASDNVNVYARWARGYKSGGFNGETDVSGLIGQPFSCTTAPGATSELCNPYRPEKFDSYELGLKTKLADGKLIFNVAGFWDEHKDIQLSVFTAQGAAASVVLNAAAARIRGLEFEAVARPVPGLTINGSLAFLDAKYKRFIDAGVDVAKNRAFPHTPKATASLGVDWRVIEGDWGKVSLTGDYNHVSAYYTFPFALTGNRAVENVASNTRSPGRDIVNASIRVTDLNLGGANTELSFWVRNLTKEDKPTNFIDFGAGFGGLTLGYFPDPRTYGLTFGVKF
ncbi:MAG: TonB-dependent receptor [Chakrabartia godavariana]